MASEPETRRQEISSTRLWFGFAASLLAWLGLGISDVLITWRECLHHEQYGGPSSHPGLDMLNIGLFCLLLAIAIVAGLMSYQNWRKLSGQVEILRAEATGSHEYVALLGVFISLTFGMGIVWLGVPLLIITLCVRTR